MSVLAMLTALLVAWWCWVMVCVVSWLVGPYIARGVACTNGLHIAIPQAMLAELDQDEIRAVLAHEVGHKHHLHAIRNLLRLCCFWPACAAQLERQEQEADDYASGIVGAAVVARALRKVSHHPAAMRRAERLERMA